MTFPITIPLDTRNNQLIKKFLDFIRILLHIYAFRR